VWGEKPTVQAARVAGDVVVLTLTGDHDLATKPMLADRLRALGGAAAFVIDLTRCTFVDSTVIGAILAACEPGRPSLSLVLPPDSSYVTRALGVVGMRDVVPVHASVGAALEALRRERRD
jgi:anti-anti-sigma factor